jgi:hypothetical protein
LSGNAEKSISRKIKKFRVTHRFGLIRQGVKTETVSRWQKSLKYVYQFPLLDFASGSDGVPSCEFRGPKVAYYSFFGNGPVTLVTTHKRLKFRFWILLWLGWRTIMRV